jgi:hypothetical protein
MNDLEVADSSVLALLEETSIWGARGVETGAFLLRDRDAPACCIALAATVGVVRRPDLFTVSGRAIAGLFSWADDNRMRIAAQVHSHRRGALLSRTDLEHGFSVRGFISAVIPFFVAPPRRIERWGWWQFDGAWQPARSPLVTKGNLRLVRFDEEGVRET